MICGVRGETLAVSQIPNYRSAADISNASGDAMDELRDYDLLVPNIELATGCAPSFLPGAPPTALAQTLSTRVYSLLHDSGLLDAAADLRIYERQEEEEKTTSQKDKKQDDDGLEEQTTTTTNQVKAYWVLYIDLLFISFDGNPFDAAWAAVVAALRDTKLPRAHWDADREMVLCSREDTGTGPGPRPLRVRGLPVACTAAVFTATRDRQRRGNKKGSSGGSGDNAGGQQQYWILVDPDRFEESLCDETVTVVVDRSQGQRDTRILGISKSGGTVVGPQVLRRLVDVAEERWLEFKKALA